MEEILQKKPRLLVSFVIDNSASISDERLGALVAGFRRFGADMKENDDFEWELICFDALAPRVVKSFEQAEVGPVPAARFPLLGRTIELASTRLMSRAAMLRKAKEEVHRPWLFVLSDGFSVDEVAAAATAVSDAEGRGELLYFPFRLGGALCARLSEIDRIKHMIEILPDQTDRFFGFVKEMATRRAELGAGEGVKFAKSDFEGWAVL